MGKSSSIEWTDATWNIAVGCSKVDADCKYCYMYRDSMSGHRYDPNFIRQTKTVFDLPLKLKEPHRIFTSSLTDVFHPGCDPFRDQMWEIIRKCPQHTFQILTKRPERITECLPDDWGLVGYENVWLGTSIGSQASFHRVLTMADVQCEKRFLSLEPLHGPIDLIPNVQRGPFNFPAIAVFDWVIVGGESGNDTGLYKYRPCEMEWIQSIVDQCNTFGVPVFVKQLGTHLAKQLKLHDRHGRDWSEWPKEHDIFYRGFP